MNLNIKTFQNKNISYILWIIPSKSLVSSLKDQSFWNKQCIFTLRKTNKGVTTKEKIKTIKLKSKTQKSLMKNQNWKIYPKIHDIKAQWIFQRDHNENLLKRLVSLPSVSLPHFSYFVKWN